MRKLVLLAGLLLAAAVIPGTPAKAEAMLGCQCVSATAAPMCVATVLECNINKGGVCVSPCSYEPPKAGKKHRGKKKKKM
jgi:hypothetical protein